MAVEERDTSSGPHLSPKPNRLRHPRLQGWITGSPTPPAGASHSIAAPLQQVSISGSGAIIGARQNGGRHLTAGTLKGPGTPALDRLISARVAALEPPTGGPVGRRDGRRRNMTTSRLDKSAAAGRSLSEFCRHSSELLLASRGAVSTVHKILEHLQYRGTTRPSRAYRYPW